MAVKYEFVGEKNNRQVVKTIDIHEESYSSFRKMMDEVKDMKGDIPGPLLGDTLEVFGGNCYGMLVSMAVEQLIAATVHQLEDKKALCVKGEDAYIKISEAVFPSICYTCDDDGAIDAELKVFSPDKEDVLVGVASCLNKDCQHIFAKNLEKALESDNRPVGEIALGILIYLAN